MKQGLIVPYSIFLELLMGLNGVKSDLQMTFTNEKFYYKLFRAVTEAVIYLIESEAPLEK